MDIIKRYVVLVRPFDFFWNFTALLNRAYKAYRAYRAYMYALFSKKGVYVYALFSEGRISVRPF